MEPVRTFSHDSYRNDVSYENRVESEVQGQVTFTWFDIDKFRFREDPEDL